MKSITFVATAVALTIVSAQDLPSINLSDINMSSLQAAASEASGLISSYQQNPTYSAAIASASSAFNSFKSANGVPTGIPNPNSSNDCSSVKPITAGILALSAAAAVGLL